MRFDNIATYPNQVAILADTIKIDEAATDGLLGVNNSLAYRVHEIERHLHGREKWFGVAASADAELHVADRVGGSIAPFALLSGASNFGSWVQILGSSDTPVADGSTMFDSHRFMVTTTDSTSPFVVQIVAGESATIAASIIAEEYTEFMYVSGTNNNDSGIGDIMSSRIATGIKAWARCECVGQTAKTLNVYFGIHEYEG